MSHPIWRCQRLSAHGLTHLPMHGSGSTHPLGSPGLQSAEHDSGHPLCFGSPWPAIRRRSRGVSDRRGQRLDTPRPESADKLKGGPIGEASVWPIPWPESARALPLKHGHPYAASTGLSNEGLVDYLTTAPAKSVPS